MNVLPKLRVAFASPRSRSSFSCYAQNFLSSTTNPSNPMHMYNALYFLQHTCTKKLLSISGHCVPVKCCMFLVSRITGWLGTYKGKNVSKMGPKRGHHICIPPPHCILTQMFRGISKLKHYTSNKKKYPVQGDSHKCKRMSNIVIPIHNHSKDTKKTKYDRLSLHRDPVSYALGT